MTLVSSADHDQGKGLVETQTILAHSLNTDQSLAGLVGLEQYCLDELSVMYSALSPQQSTFVETGMSRVAKHESKPTHAKPDNDVLMHRGRVGLLDSLLSRRSEFRLKQWPEAEITIEAGVSLAELVYSLFLHEIQHVITRDRRDRGTLKWCHPESTSKLKALSPQGHAATMIIPRSSVHAPMEPKQVHALPLLQHAALQRQLKVHDNSWRDPTRIPKSRTENTDANQIPLPLSW